MKKRQHNKNTAETSLSGSLKISKAAWITLTILGSTLLITMYGETMLLPAIPDIIKDFNISYNTSSWVLSAYLISGAVATPIAGKLSDIYGRKKMVVVIMIIYIVGVSVGGFSSDFTFLVIARIIQGIGISMFPIAFGIIRDQFPKEKLAIGIGVFSSMFAAGSVVGLSLGASIIDSFGWRMTFFLIIPIAIGLWFVIRRFIQDSPEQLEDIDRITNTESEINRSSDNKLTQNNSSNIKTSIDIKGTITLAVTVTSFLIALSYTEGENFITNSQILFFLSLGTISLILFVMIEKRSESPLINLGLMTNKIILSSNIILIITFLTMFTVYQTIPVLVTSPQPSGFGGDAITTASIQLPFMIVFLLFAPSSGFIISKLGNLKPTVIGSMIGSIGFFSLLIFHSTGFLVSINLAIIAAGLSLTQVGAFNILLESTPKKFSGISLGMTVLFNLIGSSIGPTVAGIQMETNQISVKDVIGSFPSPGSYDVIFLTIALISIISIFLAFFIRTRLVLYNIHESK